MNSADSSTWIGRGILASCLLLFLYCLYFQQMSRAFEPSVNSNKPTQAEQKLVAQAKPVTISQITLPQLPPIALPEPEQLPKLEKKPKIEQQPKPVPTKVVKTKPKTQPKIKPKAIVKAQQKVKAKAEPSPVVDVSKINRPDGHAVQLLSQVEAGRGPAIEILWPRDLAQRQQLFNRLFDCLGIQLGVLANGRVHPITPDNKQYSRLVRVVSGEMVPRESQLYASAKHRGIPVRLFPRDLDTKLLLGLARLSGLPLQSRKSAQGHYVLQGQQLFIKQIELDGQAVNGQILLASGCR